MDLEEENEEPLGYELVCYFEESQTLYEATMEGHRRPDSVDIAEADDWRPRRRTLSPQSSHDPKGELNEQNKALKDLLKQHIREWYLDLEECAGYDRGLGLADFMQTAEYEEAQEADRRFHKAHTEKMRAAKEAADKAAA